MLPKWAWSRSREQFLHCGLKKFRHSKSSVYRWYTQFDRRRFVYDTWDNGSRLGRVMVECTLFMTHCLRLNLQLHTISLVRTCRISSFCTVAWQLARLLLTRRIARSLGDSWASCLYMLPAAVARSSSDDKTLRYVCTCLWYMDASMTCFQLFIWRGIYQKVHPHANFCETNNREEVCTVLDCIVQ